MPELKKKEEVKNIIFFGKATTTKFNKMCNWVYHAQLTSKIFLVIYKISV